MLMSLLVMIMMFVMMTLLFQQLLLVLLLCFLFFTQLLCFSFKFLLHFKHFRVEFLISSLFKLMFDLFLHAHHVVNIILSDMLFRLHLGFLFLNLLNILFKKILDIVV